MVIDESVVKKVLASYEDLKVDIQRKQKLLYNELSNEDSCIAEIAYKKISYDKIGGSSNNVNDLSEIINQHQKLLRERGIEVREALVTLIKRQEIYQRIWCCYNLLDLEAYQILTKLYVNNQLYASVEVESGLSHKTFENRRKQAIQDIIRLCQGTLTNEEIMSIKIKPVVPSKEIGFIQLSFDI